MKALGYLRCSRQRGHDSTDLSLDFQESAIRDRATAWGLEIVSVLKHDGVSGGDDTRLDALASLIEHTGAEAVIVYDLDRLSRKISSGIEFIEALHERHVRLYSVTEGEIEIRSANGFLQTGIKLLLSEHLRKVSGERTKMALSRLKAQGKRYSGKTIPDLTLAGVREDLRRGRGVRETARLWKVSPATASKIKGGL